MWGGLSPQWHLLKYHLWNPGYHAGRLEELLILNRPCRPGEDVHDSVLPTSHWQAWKTWEKPKKAGVIWFVDEDAVVQHILEIISGMRSPWCENHVRELRTFFTVVLEPNIHTFSVLSETLPDFFKSKLCTQQTLF